ncbi:hypothetical protein WJX73_008339 [Symbiochloris irregularis]|uniref:BZIP domain-containing protein n=1 Tax=Symbiochloris irregularis TaxID=706552 RepID=A0AAW1P2D1_9CHLO
MWRSFVGKVARSFAEALSEGPLINLSTASAVPQSWELSGGFSSAWGLFDYPECGCKPDGTQGAVKQPQGSAVSADGDLQMSASPAAAAFANGTSGPGTKPSASLPPIPTQTPSRSPASLHGRKPSTASGSSLLTQPYGQPGAASGSSLLMTHRGGQLGTASASYLLTKPAGEFDTLSGKVHRRYPDRTDEERREHRMAKNRATAAASRYRLYSAG